MCLVGSRHYNTFGSHGSAAHVPLAYFVTLDECCVWLRTHKGEGMQYAMSIWPERIQIQSECAIPCIIADCKIVGVEITDAAHAVNTHPFHGNTAFMLGNEVWHVHTSSPQCLFCTSISLALLVLPVSAGHPKTRLVVGCMQGTGLSQQQLELCDSFVYIPQHGQGTASLNVTVAASIVLHQFSVWACYPESSRHGGKYDVAPTPLRTAPRGTCKHAGTLCHHSCTASAQARHLCMQRCQNGTSLCSKTLQSHLLT